jgi:hypothetical protein
LSKKKENKLNLVLLIERLVLQEIIIMVIGGTISHLKHILFNDAFEDDENGYRIPYRYVKQLVTAINVAGAYEKFLFIKKQNEFIKTNLDMFMVLKKLLKLQLKFLHHMVDVLFGYYEEKNRLIAHMNV